MKGNMGVRCLNGIVILSFVLMLVAAATLFPDLLHGTFLRNPEYQPYEAGVFIFLYATSIPFFLALLLLQRLCRYIIKGQPFTEQSIEAVRMIGICALLDGVLYLLGLGALFCIGLLHYGMIVVAAVIAVAALIIGLICTVITHLMESAMRLQEENKLTI